LELLKREKLLDVFALSFVTKAALD